ncbi:MAG: hypothetical protein E7345_03300 [Clostridiales bacterium]|nr:hypothetical protein [Clostridiales bacterium]
MTKVKNRYQISFLIVLISVVLSFCVFIGTITAWLMVDYEEHSEGLEIGTVQVKLYNGGTEVQGTKVGNNGEVVSTHATMTIPTNSTSASQMLISMRNTGTIDCIVRVQFNVYYLENDGNRVTVFMSGASSIDPSYPAISMTTTDWVRDLLPGVSAGELYYNKQLKPYYAWSLDSNNDGQNETSPQASNQVAIISGINIGSITEQLYIDITVDAVAFSGNIYKKAQAGESVPVEAYPFGTPDTLPEDWDAWKAKKE